MAASVRMAEDEKAPQDRCGIVDPDTGAVCTLRPHDGDKPHQGVHAVRNAQLDTTQKRPVTWTGGQQRAMVVDGYTWTRIPGTEWEVRALGERPLALRYQPLNPRGRGPRA